MIDLRFDLISFAKGGRYADRQNGTNSRARNRGGDYELVVGATAEGHGPVINPSLPI